MLGCGGGVKIGTGGGAVRNTGGGVVGKGGKEPKESWVLEGEGGGTKGFEVCWGGVKQPSVVLL